MKLRDFIQNGTATISSVFIFFYIILAVCVYGKLASFFRYMYSSFLEFQAIVSEHASIAYPFIE